MATDSEDMRIKRLRIVHSIDHYEDAREYEWPDGLDFKQVDDLLVGQGFSEVREPSDTLESYVDVNERVNDRGGNPEYIPEPHYYQFPDGWGIEDVRDFLRPIGFQRSDNRQDSMNEPNPFN